MYIHKFCRSDYDRSLHNHPWSFISLILKGGYWEVHDQNNDRQPYKYWQEPGSVLLRPAQWRHRVVLHETITGEVIPSWSLILVGKRCQPWGFYLPDGNWCWWRRHNPTKNICEEEILWTNGKD